jgi:hypothetical protein
MGLSRSLMRRLLCCCQAGIVTLVAMVLLSSMCRRICSPGIFAIFAIMLLPSLQWHCYRCQACDVSLVMMTSLPSLMCRHLCRCHNGIIALVVLAQSPTLHGHCCPCCTSIVIIILLTFLALRCMGVVTIVALALLPPSSCRLCAMKCGYIYLGLLLYAN